MNKLRATLLSACLAAATAAPAQTVTLAAAGDLIISRPLSMLSESGAFPYAQSFKAILDAIAQSDIVYGNMETSIFDSRSFGGYPYSWNGDWMLTALPAVAPDIKKMKFGILSRANNHALDWGVDGMRATIANLNAAGLVSAGTGETLGEAAGPAYLASPKGRVGIVSMVSTYRPTTNALAPDKSTPYGRPGVNGLGVQQIAVVDAASYATLSAIQCSFMGATPCPVGDRLDFLGETVRTAGNGETPFTYSYEVDQTDLARQRNMVKDAKANAAYVLATIHAHEALTEEAPPTTWQDPAAFLQTVAHDLIDAGADAFIVTGIHHVAGMEIYRNRPIFYGLGNFFWSDIQEPLSEELYESIANRTLFEQAFDHPSRATDADITNIINANSSFATTGPVSGNRTFQTVLTRTAFDQNTKNVTSITIYPVALGYGEKLTRSGVPRQADATIANLILDRIISLSANRGIAIRKTTENGYIIGVATPQ